MTRVRKEQKTTMQNEAEVTKGREKNGGRRGRGCGRGRDHSSDIHQPIESSVSSTQVLKTTVVIKCDTTIQEYEAEAGPAFDDTLNDFSISGPFKLDYSTIMDNSEKICDDDHEIETERDIHPFYIYSLTMYILKI
ncbi:hypothetical protein GLOIN_2v1846163 [Rhizophagus irregularis DAOM 181602=DAOM 197198]|uniref:Uncharacterized protein n=1 Tax=Rhizophagus irregularis (strain DAOM 181602 / DAOM 197198 / MUCL 43194) TaxID=747089 RepID=A0A2P4PCA8_RHIID|nr:hypothetical protein GLOIN_2v1846163 [Rhizophagus irregularis DAOM 181602=DAOM 197198]POG63005.1 hypothetical protein GLOIN_2v1846163 [Rhizophagus irregularis DAOM 181602=DAOM 197198]|eukprot:XP_025169871.1 hypothetical protein GLOIN_2v1846163 [Rhizophagus irregularis DAOM 181602=DAOM 197198]